MDGFSTTKYRNYWSEPDQAIMDECFSGSAQFFLQIACKLDHDEITTRRIQGLFIASLTIAVALYVSVFTDYIRQIAKNDFVEWDIKTVTSGDYTIEFDISDEFYDRFVQLHGANKPDNLPMATYFRDWIQTEMENKVSRIPDLGYEDEPPARIEIAATTFAFENAELINLLKKRGTAIRADKFDEMRKIDKQINDYKNANLDGCTRPCSVFMTFESEEGYQRARQFDEIVGKSTVQEVRNLKGWLGDQDIEIQEASEPSDIIWENRHFTPWERKKKEVVVAIVIGLALLLSFGAVFYGRKKQAEVYARYPIPASCDPFYTTYGDDLEQFAVTDYTANTRLEE